MRWGELLACQSPTTDKKTNDVQPTPSQSWKANYDWVEPLCENSVVKVRKNHKFGLVDPKWQSAYSPLNMKI